MDSEAARKGFALDMGALETCDAVVLLLPCGRSAHLEAGWAKGNGKHLCIVTAEGMEPELMYRMADHIALDLVEAAWWLGSITKVDWLNPNLSAASKAMLARVMGYD